jgi:hypothetical protein
MTSRLQDSHCTYRINTWFTNCIKGMSGTNTPTPLPRCSKIANSKLIHTHSGRNMFLYDTMHVPYFQRELCLGYVLCLIFGHILANYICALVLHVGLN